MADSMDKKYSNVPILRFPEFNDEWKLTSYNLLFEFQNGINGSPEKYGKGIKYISVMDILNNQYITYSNIKGLIDATEKEQQNFMVGYGDVLFQRSSETPEDAGKSNVYLDSKPCVFGGFVIRGKKIGNYNPIFIKYALASNANRKKMIRLGAGAQHVNIGQNNLNSLKISLPSEFEQEKIALLFDAIDKKIETQNKIIRNLESLYKGIKEKIIKCTTNHKSIADFLEEVVAKTTVQDEFPVLSSTVKGLFLQTDYFTRNIASENNIGYKIVKKNQIIISPQNLWMGNMTFNDKFEHGIVSPSYKVYKIKEGYVADYIVSILTTKRAFYYFSQVSEQGASVVRRNLNIDAFEQLSFPVPPFERQQHFSKLIRSVKNKLECETNYLEKLLIQKKYLLENLFI